MIREDRYNINAYYNVYSKYGTISTKYGYFISDLDFSNFDVSIFTLTPTEAE